MLLNAICDRAEGIEYFYPTHRLALSDLPVVGRPNCLMSSLVSPNAYRCTCCMLYRSAVRSRKEIDFRRRRAFLYTINVGCVRLRRHGISCVEGRSGYCWDLVHMSVLVFELLEFGLLGFGPDKSIVFQLLGSWLFRFGPGKSIGGWIVVIWCRWEHWWLDCDLVQMRALVVGLLWFGADESIGGWIVIWCRWEHWWLDCCDLV